MDADFRSFIGKSFDEVQDDFEEIDNANDESFENFRNVKIKNDINRKKQFKQENKG